jgi:hypothetical protein
MKNAHFWIHFFNLIFTIQKLMENFQKLLKRDREEIKQIEINTILTIIFLFEMIEYLSLTMCTLTSSLFLSSPFIFQFCVLSIKLIL